MSDSSSSEPASDGSARWLGVAVVPIEENRREEADVVLGGVRWLQDWAEEIDPDRQAVTTHSGSMVGHDFLSLFPGIQLDWH